MSKRKKIEFPLELIAQAQAGDPKAREELFARVRAYLRGIARRPGSVQATPSDLTHDAVEDVLRGLEKFEGSPIQFKAWLATILHNGVATTVRNAKRQKRDVAKVDSIENQYPEGVPSDQPTQSELTGSHEKLRIVLGILFDKQKISANYRDVIILRFFYKMRMAAIAQRLEMTEAGVDSLCRRALVKLRKLYLEQMNCTPEQTSRDTYKRRAAVFTEYMRRCDAGVAVDFKSFVAEYADKDPELRSMLEWIVQLRSIHFDKDDGEDEDT